MPVTLIIKEPQRMANWWDIPKEVLNIIFLYVKANDKSKSKKNLSQCSLTCRDWRVPAQNVLFTEISVDTTTSFDSLMRVALENDGLKNWVKVLEYGKGCICTTAMLLAADLLFSNLEALGFFLVTMYCTLPFVSC